MSGHLSRRFDIKKGTEQGHPLSPDLFKLYLNDLSPLLEYDNCPVLDSMVISHLLWADDLILLSLDKETTQKQLDQLNQYCKKWGIDINLDKIKAMVLVVEEKGTCLPNFNLGGSKLEVVNDYCYLVLILNKSGSLKLAQSTLKTKAMRAFFGLKRTINKSNVSFRALTTLFDSLIKPIVLYGAPIWVPPHRLLKC